eukprot:1581466-Prymnesium_polylepis.2
MEKRSRFEVISYYMSYYIWITWPLSANVGTLRALLRRALGGRGARFRARVIRSRVPRRERAGQAGAPILAGAALNRWLRRLPAAAACGSSPSAAGGARARPAACRPV